MSLSTKAFGLSGGIVIGAFKAVQFFLSYPEKDIGPVITTDAIIFHGILNLIYWFVVGIVCCSVFAKLYNWLNKTKQAAGKSSSPK